jgi:hypothetical protein
MFNNYFSTLESFTQNIKKLIDNEGYSKNSENTFLLCEDGKFGTLPITSTVITAFKDLLNLFKYFVFSLRVQKSVSSLLPSQRWTYQ